ncbi:MAG: helix-turn-helix domain-containing protein [Bacillus sp. (in: Bacteria)]|nr:helix-turn-helix domain-containing protein [Bacillus sp. (in: firmicutes)]MCM1428092.1 helix-turn-helix domain-containing protein [Eubacterium sp.]
MIRDINAKIDYVAEGVALLHHLGTGETFPALKESLSKKYHIAFTEGAQKFELLSRIEQNARNILRDELAQIQYYFSVYGENEAAHPDISCAGMLALLWNRQGNFETTEHLRQFLQSLSDKEYCAKFGELLQYYEELIKDESKIVTIDEPLAVISYIMKMDITDKEKWKLQEIFCDRKEHQEKILSLLDKAVFILRSFHTELEELTMQFYSYWNAVLQEQSITAYLHENAVLELGENPLGFRLSPSIIDCNCITMNLNPENDGKTYTAPDNYIIGILFGSDFPIRQNRTQDEKNYADYAAQVLKLLSDKSKFEILTYIRDKASYGSELAKHLHLTTPTVSHHMTALISAELVTIKREENRVYYLSNKKKIDEVLRYCNQILTGGS